MPDRDERRLHQAAAAQVRRFSTRARRAVETALATNWVRWAVEHRASVSQSRHRARVRIRLLERVGHNLLKRLASEHPHAARLAKWARYHTHHGEPDHQDQRYPRKRWFRFIRLMLRGWWLIFFAIFGVVITNLLVLVHNVVFQGKQLRVSDILGALWVDHIVGGLQSLPMPTLLVACILASITLSGQWASRDFKHEIRVIERCNERGRIQRQIEDQLRQHSADMHALEARLQAFRHIIERRFGPLDELVDGDGFLYQDTSLLDTPEEQEPP